MATRLGDPQLQDVEGDKNEEEEEVAGGCEEEQQRDGRESLSHRAEVFRSKLIEGFQILDCVTEEGREKAPIYNSSDIISTNSAAA